MTTIPSCCIIVLFCLIVWCVVIFFFFGSEFPVTQHKMRVCWSYNENKSKSNEIKFFIQNIWHMILTVSRPCSLLTTMDAYTCLSHFYITSVKVVHLHRRNVPVPPLFGLGVPYPPLLGHRWRICCHQRRSVEIKLHYSRFRPGLCPGPHHQRAHVLSWFPSMRSLWEGLQG